MTPLSNSFAIVGGVCAALGVAFGAFGAHALKPYIDPGMFSVYQTGVHYHLFHALGLFAVAFCASHLPHSSLIRWSGWLMFTGIVIFSGSLYILSITGIRGWGMVTPVGGLTLIVSWVLLALALVRHRSNQT